jgi:heat shock protein HtpX
MRAFGLRTHIWNNFWKSAFLLAGFPFLLGLTAFGLGLIVFDTGGGFSRAWARATSHFWLFYLAGFGVALIWFLIATAASNRILDAVTGARAVTRAGEPRLWNLLENLAISRGMRMPRLAIIETDARNAFAAGLTREQGSVTVTRGLMAALDDRELAAVLGHELTHIRNGDARLAVVAAIFAGVLSLGFEWANRGSNRRSWSGPRRSRSSSTRDSGTAEFLGIAMIALASALAAVLRMALSRNREYLADAGAVELTQDPDAMITALRKIAGHSDIEGVPSQVRAMFFDDNAGSLYGQLMATHPSIEQRIQALVKFAGGRDPGPIVEPPAEATPVSAQEPAPWTDTNAAPAAPAATGDRSSRWVAGGTMGNQLVRTAGNGVS